jgi:hypothetical protein
MSVMRRGGTSASGADSREMPPRGARADGRSELIENNLETQIHQLNLKSEIID